GGVGLEVVLTLLFVGLAIAGAGFLVWYAIDAWRHLSTLLAKFRPPTRAAVQPPPTPFAAPSPSPYPVPPTPSPGPPARAWSPMPPVASPGIALREDPDSGLAGPGMATGSAPPTDRKSTRLKSSHVE